MYIKRYIETAIEEIDAHFKVLYVSGPRQVGKTTVLQHLAKKRNMAYVTLDDLRLRSLAQKDPALFIESFSSPLFIDEVQYAPELFSYIKLKVDQKHVNGQYWLTGSQHLSLMQGLKESLAGRVGILALLGLSRAEEEKRKQSAEPFLPAIQHLKQHQKQNLSPASVFSRIFRGTFPVLVTDPDMPLEPFYGSYVQTYLDRDVRDLFGVEKMSSFQTFLGLCAARTGQVLNVSDLARDAGVSVHAAKSWLSILEASGLVYFLQPFFANISKRLIKAPKMYFLDTGLAAYLTKWPDAVTLQHGSMAGAMFETYVVSEIVKSYLLRGLKPPLYYVRTQEGTEIDLLIQKGDTFHPLEVKMTASPHEDDARAISFMEKHMKRTFKHGAIISLTDTPFPLTATVSVLPVSVIE